MMLSTWDVLADHTADGLDIGDTDAIRVKLHEASQSVQDMVDRQEEFNQQVSQGSGAVDGLARKLAGVAAGIGFAKLAKDAVAFASDLTEVQNVVDTTFGAAATAEINEWAQTTLDGFGLNELSAKQYAGTMGAMLKSSGITGDGLREMSMRVTELAGDMASFYNLSGDEAFAKIRSGLSGEAEPLKQLGINMSVANLEAYALAQGMNTAYSEMSQAEQVALRYEYLMHAASDASGDFAKTSGSFSNQQKLLQENWTALTGELAANTLPILAVVFSTLNDGMGILRENIDVIGPLLLGLLSIFGAYLIALGTYNTIKAVSAVVEGIHATAMAATTGATFAETAAQYGFNAALLACPVTWIVVAILALIAALIALAAYVARTGDTANTTFGVIAGALAALGAFIINTVIGVVDGALQLVWSFVTPFIGIIEWILNACNGGFDSFGGAVANLIGQIISWFLDLGKVVTRIIDAIFGTNWTEGLNGLQDKVLAWGKSDEAITLNRDAPTLESWTRGDVHRIGYGDAYAAGAEWGDGISESISEKFNLDTNTVTWDGLEAPGDTLTEIADNTGAAAKALDVTQEDLKYLRDLAERDVVNRFTTAEVRVEMGGVTNNVSRETDLDGVVDYLVTGVSEALEIAAEGDYL